VANKHSVYSRTAVLTVCKCKNDDDDDDDDDDDGDDGDDDDSSGGGSGDDDDDNDKGDDDKDDEDDDVNDNDDSIDDDDAYIYMQYKKVLKRLLTLGKFILSRQGALTRIRTSELSMQKQRSTN
jgi:hypothetical protein